MSLLRRTLGHPGALGLAASLFLAVASSGWAQGQAARYSVVDTGHRFAGLPSTIQPIFWLDDNRILYTGWDPRIKHVRKEDGQSVTKVGIYTLDLRSNQATRHADAEGFLCYRNGYVRYLVTYDPKTRIAVTREGKFGEESEVVTDMKLRPAGHRVNPLTCRYFDATGNATLRGKRIPLLDGHGVLEFSRVTDSKPGSPMHPARLFPVGDKEPIVLPVSGAAISESRVRYYEFSDVYTIGYVPPEGFPTTWPKNAIHRVYLMSPRGEIKEIPMSGGDWSKWSIATFVLTRGGVVVYGGALHKHLDPGTTGIYLVQGTGSARLISGLLKGIGVSPSGCKLAAAMQTYRKIPDPTLIKIVNVCGEERIK